MTARYEAAGTGRWAHSYHAPKTNLRTEKPPIPEPMSRVGPPGVSSGVSFRNLPDASLNAIKDICTHYEKKSSGKYSSDSLASRYIFQMTREILAQLQCLTHGSSSSGQRLRDLESVLQEWYENFGSTTEDGTQGIFGLVPMTPKAVKIMLCNQRERISGLEDELAQLKDSQDSAKKVVVDLMDTHVEANRIQANTDRVLNQRLLIEMREQCEIDVKKAADEVAKAREEAKNAIIFDHQRAEATIETLLDAERSEKEQIKKSAKEREEKLNREWSSKTRHLEIKVNSFEENKKNALHIATERLNTRHAAQLINAVRESALAASNAAMAKNNKGSTAGAEKERVRKRMEGGRVDKVLSADTEMFGRSADEEARGIDRNDTFVVEVGSGGRSGVRGGGGGESNKLLTMKLKNQVDESDWLRTRVTDLETMVRTLRTSIEGSLEVRNEIDKGEEFKGWRQVVTVDYPWLRDRKREDPARYSYLDKSKGERNKKVNPDGNISSSEKENEDFLRGKGKVGGGMYKGKNRRFDNNWVAESGKRP